MNDNDKSADNNLSVLWHAQPVSNVDVDEVKKTFKSQTRKQRLYFLIDCLSLVPAVWIFIHSWDELPVSARTLFLGLMVIVIPLLGYQMWLRRIAAFDGSNAQTADHVQKLKKQFKNNARIALINKHSAWVAVLIVIAFNITFTLDEAAEDREYAVMLLATGVTAGIMAAWYVWAHRRQRNFEKKLKALNEMHHAEQ